MSRAAWAVLLFLVVACAPAGPAGTGPAEALGHLVLLAAPWVASRFAIPPGADHAVTVALCPGDLLELSWAVQSGANRDVDVVLAGPRGEIDRRARSLEGDEVVTADLAGPYSMTFSNRFSLLTTKVVEVRWRASHRSGC